MSPAGARDRLDVNIKQKSFRAASGGKLQVLGELAFSLGSGQVAALVGPSGCGKTTLLRIVAGLDRDFDGGVALPAHGTLGMVFQEPRLLPWRTVEQNVRLAAPHATAAGLDTLFQTLGLKAHRNHYPGELSLGLARRVALARAFAVEPDLLLLDEPFVSLDDALAARLREELAELVNRRPVTTLLVTHNLDEAAGLADRLLLLSVSPARILADVAVARPRARHTAAELADLREEIARRLNQALLCTESPIVVPTPRGFCPPEDSAVAHQPSPPSWSRLSTGDADALFLPVTGRFTGRITAATNGLSGSDAHEDPRIGCVCSVDARRRRLGADA